MMWHWTVFVIEPFVIHVSGSMVSISNNVISCWVILNFRPCFIICFFFFLLVCFVDGLVEISFEQSLFLNSGGISFLLFSGFLFWSFECILVVFLFGFEFVFIHFFIFFLFFFLFLGILFLWFFERFYLNSVNGHVGCSE